MKHRTLHFGYEIQNGIIQINKAETQTVIWIFTEYLNGSNLKEIAESLTSQKIEYMPDKYDWNKNRIKRIIEDRRYAGDGKYPKIISQRMFEQANAVKEEKRTTKSYMVDASNKPLVYAVRCSYCGKTMIHNTNRKAKYAEQWVCGTENCGTKIYMTIEQIEQADTGEFDEQFESLMSEIHRLEDELAEIETEKSKWEKSSENLEQISAIIEGLKNHPVPYDDIIVRQLIYYIKVVSKNMIQIYFKDGTTLDAEI